MSKSDSFARVAIAAVGALVLSASFIAAAVGPAAHSTAQPHVAYASVEPGHQARG
jgi:hypothetical protein